MKSVLIVDDEQIVLDVLQRILSRLGYNTIVSGSGEEAIQTFNQNAFDLVLLDVLMPERNGFEIAKIMRRTRPGQKIVMVTGLGEEAVEAQAISEKIGIDTVLSKPFSFDKVRSILDNLLNDEDEKKKEVA